MDYNTILNEIKNKLPEVYKEINTELEEITKEGSTGGEINSKVGLYLMNLKQSNKNAYYIIEEEISKYIKSLEKEGLIFWKRID